MKKVTIFLLAMLFHYSLLFGQWSTIEMPTGRIQSFGASTNDKFFVVGGIDSDWGWTDFIYTYDANLEEWSIDLYLTEGRGKIACATNGNKLFCGGGINFDNLEEYSIVEIYDLSTNTLYDTIHLSVPRVELSAVAVGSKVLFAGGLEITGTFNNYDIQAYSTVDIYDINTEDWTTDTLSEARGGMAYAVLGDKAFFAGGYKGDSLVSDVVDIYNASNGEWTTATLSQARAFYGAGAAAQGKVYFAGGILEDNSTSKVIDIYDPSNGEWSFTNLSEARFGVQASSTGNHIVFANGGQGSLAGWTYTNDFSTSKIVDVYDAVNDTMSSYSLNIIRINHFSANIGNKVFIIGGFDGGGFASTIDVFDETIVNTNNLKLINPTKIFPNPVSDILFIEKQSSEETIFKISNLDGKIMKEFKSTQNKTIDLSELPKGFYFLIEYSQKGNLITKRKIVKM